MVSMAGNTPAQCQNLKIPTGSPTCVKPELEPAFLLDDGVACAGLTCGATMPASLIDS